MYIQYCPQDYMTASRHYVYLISKLQLLNKGHSNSIDGNDMFMVWRLRSNILLVRLVCSGRIKGEQLRKTSQIGKKAATWTPSVSPKVNISDIPPSTLACRGQRSWWQTSDPGALRGQKRSLWNPSVGGLGTFSPAQQLQLLSARCVYTTCGSEGPCGKEYYGLSAQVLFTTAESRYRNSVCFSTFLSV